VSFEVPLLDTEPAPTYQRIARDADHLNQLGLSVAAVARHLRVDHKTVAKAIRWQEDQS
jgi:predicted transposase YdaD